MSDKNKRRGGRGPIKVKTVQVGDPAVGFVLQIPEEAPYPLPNLTVQVWAECPGLETAHSVVVVRNPTYDRLMTFVVPIGAPEGECIGRDYRITIAAHYEIQGVPIELGTVTEYQISESGNFKLVWASPIRFMPNKLTKFTATLEATTPAYKTAMARRRRRFGCQRVAKP